MRGDEFVGCVRESTEDAKDVSETKYLEDIIFLEMTSVNFVIIRFWRTTSF